MAQTSSNMNIALPTLRKDIVLMSPGVWNGFEYAAEDIKRAFEMTDWKHACNLFLDHPENPNNAAGLWAGRIVNQRYTDGQIIGDLQLWDESVIIKTELAKAPFGVSPRVIGEEVGNKFSNFVFDNFSIVSKQAIGPAYINLSKTPATSQILHKEEPAIQELNSEPEKQITPEVAAPQELSEVEIILNKIKNDEELTEEELACVNKKIKKRQMDKVEEPSCSKEDQQVKGGKNEMSETNQESGLATQTEKKELSFDNLSIEELSAILEQVQKVIASKTPAVKEMASNQKNEELEALKNQVKELSSMMNKPAPKTMRSANSGQRAQLSGPKYSEGVQELAAILRNGYC